MSKKLPRTLFSTPLSGSARETEIRLRNIFSGPKKRPPLPFLVLIFSVCILCGNIVSCHMAESEAPDVSNPASSSQDIPDWEAEEARFNNMVLDFLRTEYQCAAYLPENIPENPQPGDRCLDSSPVLASGFLDEILYSLCEVDSREYTQDQGWQSASPAYVVLTMPSGVDFTPVAVRNYSEDVDPSDIMCQALWGLQDLEVCLFRDGFSTPVGPGNWVEPMFLEFEPEIIIHDDWEPVHWPGDYWDEWSVDGITALRYYSAEPNRWSLNSMKVTRDDMYTPRGIRVGATRAEVEETYPEAIAGDYWGLYPEEDILCYIPWRNPEDADGFYSDLGPALVFLFDGDTVRQISLHNMFN